MKNVAYLLSLHLVNGIGPIRLRKIVDYFQDPKLAWDAKDAELFSIGIPKSVIEKLKEAKVNFDPESFLEKINKSNIKFLTFYDDSYPKSLKEIYDPPMVIYYRGNLQESDFRAIGVVGTRKVTGYGRLVTEEFTKGLVEAGFTIVSGLAKGVDTIAHQVAVAKKGRTLAILGGGIENIFPYENTSLAKQIASGFGAVISEFPPNAPHLPGNFPARNRIISGLSLGVLVTEAAQDSGSLITAHLALEQGKEVFAVPGPITSNLSRGPADLIKQGAALVFNVDDLLTTLGVERKVVRDVSNIQLSESEKIILEYLKNQTRHIDEISRDLNKPSAEISAGLIKMEIFGLVKNLGGGNYTKLI